MTEHIKINSTVPRAEYAADGMTTAYPAPFAFLKAADLKVWIGSAKQQPDTDYTVTGEGTTAGGTVTFTSPPATGQSVVISRQATVARMSDFLPGGSLRADTLNDELDRLTLALQEAEAARERSLRIADHDADAAPGALPTRALRASRVLAFDDQGDPVAGPASNILSDIEGAVSSVTEDAAAAAASALSAAGDAASVANVAALVQNIPATLSATGDGETVAFTLSRAPVDDRALLVSLDGIIQHGTAFATSDNVLTFASAPPDGVAIEIRDLSATAIIDAAEVSALAAISDAIPTVAAISSDVSSVAAAETAISDVATDLNGANTIGAAVAAASAAAASETGAAASATAASASAVSAAASEANAEASESGAVSAQALAEIAQTAAEAARAGAEAAETGAGTAETNAAVSASAAAASASSASGAVADAIIAAARGTFRNRFDILPSAILGFDLGEVSQIVLTRATAGFTDTDGGGIESKGIDTPRLTHDPETGEPLGLLLEPQQTNHMIHSDLQPGGIGVTNTAGNALAPDGTMTARTIFQTADSGGHAVGNAFNTTGVVSGTRYIVAMDVKEVGTVPTQHAFYAYVGPFDGAASDYFGWRWDFATETLTPYKTSSSTVTVGHRKLGAGWYRLWASVVAPGASGTSGFVLQFTDGIGGATSFAGDTNAGIAVKGCRCIPASHADALPPSQIETDGSQVTRSADLAIVDLSAQTAFRPDGFSILVEAEILDDDGTLLAIGKTATQEVALDLQGGDLHVTSSSGLNLTAASGLAPGDRIVATLRMAENDVAVSVNGATVVTESSHTLHGDANEMRLGTDLSGTSNLPCVIRQVAIFGPLPDARLEAMSNG
ncbi:hypothetical protein [Minwuia sp. IMCC3060]|uniref:phage head spike fiber domain-containing protein n=1 Tax=Minwuia sp. IMCC3060 TaxID=3040675 RepID=UPI0024793503|nr:hypothetical protein [Minwuia sp. IMCC3060]